MPKLAIRALLVAAGLALAAGLGSNALAGESSGWGERPRSLSAASGAARSSPPPPGSLSPARPLASRPGCLEPGHLQGAGRPPLGCDHRLHRRPRRGSPASRFRLSARLRHPLHGRRTPPAPAPDPLHRLRKRERSRPLPDPRNGPRSRAAAAATATATCWSSTAPAAASTSSTAPSSCAGAAITGMPASGVEWNLRSQGAATRRRHLGRRRRAADLPRADPLRRGPPGPHPPRDPDHLRRHPRRLDPSRLALRRGQLQPQRPADGPAPAAAPRLRARPLQRPGQGDRQGAQALRGDRRRQRHPNWFFGGTSDRRWNDQNLDQLKRIPGRAFEVVRSAPPVTHRC